MAINQIKFGSHEEWLDIRKHYIGGSDAGAVMGLSDYATPYSVWAEKTGKTPGFEGNTITKAGSYLEDFVAKLFEDETGKKVRRRNVTFVNDDFPWACANIDREVVGEDAILEIKTTNNWKYSKRLHGEEYPEVWYCQMMHYMAVTEKKKAYLAVLIECRDFKIFELDRSDREIEAIMSAEKDFWDHVESNTPPTIDGYEPTSNAIKTIYSQSEEGLEADLSDMEFEFRNHEQFQKQIKALTEADDAIVNRIKVAMGNAEKGYCGSYKVSFKTQSRRTFDSKAYIKDHGEFDDSYYKVTESRPFKFMNKEK